MTKDKYSLKGLFNSEQKCYRVFGVTICEGRLMLLGLAAVILIVILLVAPFGQRYLASIRETVVETQEAPRTQDEWYFSALTAPQQFDQARHWIAYLVGPHQGSAVEDTLSQFDVGCFAWHEGPIGNQLTCKYVSTMLAQSWMPNYASEVQPIINAGGSLGSDPGFGGYVMNPGNQAWQDYVLDTLIPWVVINGTDGLFLDTFGFIDEPQYQNYRAAALQFLGRIHSRYPQYFKIINEGDYLFPEAAAYVDGFVFQNFRLNAQGEQWNPFPYPGQVEAVERVAGTDVKLLTLEATYIGNDTNEQTAYSVACTLGMLPAFESILNPDYVSTLPLDSECDINLPRDGDVVRPGDPNSLGTGVSILRDILGTEPYLFAFDGDDTTTADDSTSGGTTPSNAEAPPARKVTLPEVSAGIFQFSDSLRNHLLNYLTGPLSRYKWPQVILETEHAF